MNPVARGAIGLLLLAVLCGSAIALLHAGIYGLTIFLVHPFLLGCLTSWLFRPASGMQAAGYAFLAVAAVVAFLFLIGVEGAICILLTMPLTVLFAIWGAYATHRSIDSPAAARNGLAMLLLLPPVSLTFDTHAQPLVYQVHTAVTIAAPPEQVWKHIVHLSTLPAPHEWYFRAGMAYPTQAHIEGAGAGATRFCEFSTGPVVESIDIWDAPRLMHFRVTETPAAMREWSPYGEISTKHLHGYFISRAGEFRLTELPGNRTLLEGTSWYQHGLWPAQYWRWWSDALVHRIHLRVFRQIKTLAEAGRAMTVIEELTEIHAPIERCFDLARSVEVHLLGNIHYGEQAVATAGVTTGLIGLGQRVTWRAKHFGFWHQLTSEITQLERPVFFQDVQVHGIFRSMRHDHFFRALSPDRTEMRDVFAFAAPIPILGRLTEIAILARYIRALLIERNAVIKQVAESS